MVINDWKACYFFNFLFFFFIPVVFSHLLFSIQSKFRAVSPVNVIHFNDTVVNIFQSWLFVSAQQPHCRHSFDRDTCFSRMYVRLLAFIFFNLFYPLTYCLLFFRAESEGAGEREREWDKAKEIIHLTSLFEDELLKWNNTPSLLLVYILLNACECTQVVHRQTFEHLLQFLFYFQLKWQIIVFERYFQKVMMTMSIADDESIKCNNKKKKKKQKRIRWKIKFNLTTSIFHRLSLYLNLKCNVRFVGNQFNSIRVFFFSLDRYCFATLFFSSFSLCWVRKAG